METQPRRSGDPGGVLALDWRVFVEKYEKRGKKVAKCRLLKWGRTSLGTLPLRSVHRHGDVMPIVHAPQVPLTSRWRHAVALPGAQARDSSSPGP